MMSVAFLATAVMVLVSVVPAKTVEHRGLAQRRHQHASEAVPFAYCKPYLSNLPSADQHQLRESYQHYHTAFAKYMRASRNLEFFRKGPATWIEDPAMRQGWNLTYLFGFNEPELAAMATETETALKNMEQRIRAQLSALEAKGLVPAGTHIDQLSPCIMTKVYPDQFPDQPAVSLLLRLRGKAANPDDWPAVAPNTMEPPIGRGPEAVAAFISRLEKCKQVAPVELVVMLSGAAAQEQATTWAWQSWTTDGFVVPILDAQDREAHGLNRLASVARGSLLVALRSDRPNVDDLMPSDLDCSWLQRLMTVYHRVPQLGAMAHGRFSFSHPAMPSSLRVLGQVPGAGGPQRNNMFFKDSMTSVPFQYVLYGDYMPVSFRVGAFEEVGGFDEDLPQGDEPCSSLIRREFFLRLWKSGWRVGANDIGLTQEPHVSTAPGENSDPTRCPEPVALLAAQLFESRHGPPSIATGAAADATLQPPMQYLMERVKELNLRTLSPLDDNLVASCPMAQGCTLSA